MSRFLVLVPICFVVAAAPAAAAQRCDLPGATTVTADAQARVFSVPGGGQTLRRYFGCLTGHRPFQLASDLSPKASDETHTANTMFNLAGAWVAWHSSSSSDFGAGEFVENIEARSLAGVPRKLSIPVTGEPLTALDVLDDGTVGWVLNIGDYREIDAVARGTTTPAAIAYTRGIDSQSVRFASDQVTWTQNGAAHSAPLTAPAPPPSGLSLGAQALDGRVGDCGTLVPAAVTGSFSEAAQLAQSPDGEVVAAGVTSSGSGDPIERDTFVITRSKPDGSFDPAFGTGGVVQTLVPRAGGAQNVALSGVEVQPDDRVLIAGTVRTDATGQDTVILYRLAADGSPDPSFGSGGIVRDAIPADTSADVRTMKLLADGSVLIAGQRDNHFYVARLRPDGTLDASFGTGGMAVDPGKDVSEANALAIEPDGTIFAGGQAASEPMLIRFNPGGVAQSGDYHGPPAASAIVALAPMPDGGVMAIGAASNVVAKDQLFLARYTATGASVPGFGSDGWVLDPQVSRPAAMAVDAEGRMLVTASFDLLPGSYFGTGLVRYLADGTRDTSFGLRGALGGVSSQGLTSNDVLLDAASGTALVAQGNGDRFALSRFALDAPATAAVAAEPSVCAMATGTRIGPLRGGRKLGVSLRLRAPGRVRLSATITAAGRTFSVGHVSVFRPFIEGAIATIPVSALAAKRLRGVKRAQLVVLAGAPGAAAKRYAVPLSG